MMRGVGAEGVVSCRHRRWCALMMAQLMVVALVCGGGGVLAGAELVGCRGRGARVAICRERGQCVV